MTRTRKTSERAPKAPSLTERAYATLREEIITCALRPGTDIGEQELATRLEMSKTPVREALARLAMEGLVETFPRRGYRVTPVTVKDITDIFTLRRGLECVAAELAAQRMSDAELDALEEISARTYPSVDQTLQRPDFVAANHQFHLAIAEGAKIPRLHHMISGYLEECTRLFHMGAMSRDLTPETKEDHIRIVAALRARDSEAARDAISQHTENTRRGLLNALIADMHSPLEL